MERLTVEKAIRIAQGTDTFEMGSNDISLMARMFNFIEDNTGFYDLLYTESVVSALIENTCVLDHLEYSVREDGSYRNQDGIACDYEELSSDILDMELSELVREVL